MKRFFLIVILILSAFLAGIIGAYGVVYFHTPQLPEHTSEVTIPVPTASQDEPSENSLYDIQETIIDIAQDVAPSVVSIIIKKDLVVYRSDPWGFFQQPTGTISRQVGGGSGFFVQSDGTILTNKHVVSDENAQYTVILNDGTEYDANVVGVDPLNDLAIIKIDDTQKVFPVLPLIENNDDIHIGEFSIAIGNALAEFQNSVSLGIVSGTQRHIEAGGTTLSGLIQTDAAINPGNSGGPLIDLDGNVMGINTAIVAGSNGVGFAIALTKHKIEYMLESLKEHGRIKRPFIGISYIPNSPGVAAELGLPVEYGVYVIDETGSVIEGSSAQKAGIEPGDIITNINGVPITTEYPLNSIIQNTTPGEVFTLDVIKKSGEERFIELKLGEY